MSPNEAPLDLVGRSDMPRRAAVLGWPISHSLSPLIHRTWADREGVPAYYVPIAVEPDYDSFARACDALRTLGFQGCNVTLPHKEHALRYADHLTPAAQAIGAANMLSFDHGALADNSDATGLATALALPPRSYRALVLGAGGAGRAAAYALSRLVGSLAGYSVGLTICNRSQQKAQEVAQLTGARVCNWNDRNAAMAEADVFVNATSLGMAGKEALDLDIARLPASAVVCDIVYAPLETPLLAAARARGLRCVDGLEMLMRQAVPGYLAWLGTTASVDAPLRQTLIDAIARRVRAP